MFFSLFLRVRSHLSKAFFITLILFSFSALADQLFLINGDTIKGQLVTFSNGMCLFQSELSGLLEIKKQNIKGVNTKTNKSIKFTDGETLIGQLSYHDGKQTLSSKRTGKLAVSVKNFSSITNILIPKNGDITTKQKKDNYGSDQHKSPPLDFLNRAAVLLSKGESQFEFDFAYQRTRQTFPALFNSNVILNTTERKMTATIGYNYGLTSGLEIWLKAPYIATTVENVSGNSYVDNGSTYKLGDMQFGLQYQITKQTLNWPSVAISLQATAPTGARHYYTGYDSWKSYLSTGSGHWKLSPSIDFTKKLDPVILFGGINYQYTYGRRIDGTLYEPGAGYGLNAGVGFAINPRVSVSSQFQWAYYENLHLNKVNMQGSNSEPTSLGLSSSYRLNSGASLQTTVAFGLNDDAGFYPFLQISYRKVL